MWSEPDHRPGQVRGQGTQRGAENRSPVQDGFKVVLRQMAKRNGFSFWPGCCSWLAAMTGEQIHLGILRKPLQGPRVGGVSCARA